MLISLSDREPKTIRLDLMLDIFQTAVVAQRPQSEIADRPETTTFGNAELSRTASCRRYLKARSPIAGSNNSLAEWPQ
jgi:hypothetical protein